MKDSMVLAEWVAKRGLMFSWNEAMVKDAFGPRASDFDGFGGALRLLGPLLDEAVVNVLVTFDTAGMDKDEMAEAIWAAAEDYFEDKLKEKNDDRIETTV